MTSIKPEEREEAIESLHFIVQYRLKDQTQRFDPWHTMAGFDVEGAAEKYCSKQSSDFWEYRWIALPEAPK